MVEVVTRREKPDPKVRTDCRHCTSELIVKKSETILSGGQRDPCRTFACPVCKTTNYLSCELFR